ncbi:unnamed protein product [Lathyrus sativus]|nr:unnamed protein product [Lathyrus sativus]
MGLISVIFHHGGNFIHEKHTFYKEGSETIVKGQDPDKWSFFEAVSLVKEWGHNGFKLWRKILGFDEGFVHFIDDLQAVENGIEEMLSKVLRPNVNQFSECNDDVRGIRFDDSEEERTCHY